ncbi:MAG: multidrug effflux MFS transporter [Propionibacteriaceae bacterium]|jgi:DHA1 family bicyclomycin/chloramphenicol resistance-like MFS transporter|nr:multidrug effflux MFS transporter [Propionibacteriaceae bacterium]
MIDADSGYVEPPRYRATPKYVLMLGVMSALGAVSTDMYLPNLPDVAGDLGTSETMAQITMTSMMIGGAIGQITVGPLSDRFGRRAPALLGTALHVLTAIGCAFAPAIAPLIGLRLMMGIFNASAGVTSMAIIRDRFIGREASALMSRLMLVIGVAPLLAPTIGSLIGDWAGWRGVFFALAVYGVVLWLVIWLKLPETLPRERRVMNLPWKTFGVLLRDRYFVGLAVLPSLLSAVLMSYVVGSPFVLKEGYGLTSLQFSLVFACNGMGLVAGAQLNAALVKHFTSAQILRVSLPVTGILALVLLLVGGTGYGGLPGLLLSLFALVFTINISPPNAAALALARHGETAGTAASFIGFLQGVVPATVAPLVSIFGGSTANMAAVMASAAFAAIIVLASVTPIYRSGGVAELDSATLQ